MVDLDRFKLINDTYGHLEGDAVLCEAARRMKAAGRCYDSIGRYGGEEFLIVLPGCDQADACAQAERVRESVAASAFADGGAPLRVTCSIGVSCWHGGDADSLTRAADEALYHAKSSGRNRVVAQVAHRIMVMRAGRIVGAVTGAHMNENEIVVLATGVKSGEAA